MNTAHRAMANVFAQKDPRTMGFLKFLQEIYPAFAAKIFKSNGVMAKYVQSGMNSSDILDNFICGHCEALAPWNGYAMKDNKPVPKATCLECGSDTVNPVTLRVWMWDELRHKAPPEVIALGEVALDMIAAKMLAVANMQLSSEMQKDAPRRQKQMGILMPDGSEHAVSRAKIEVNEKPLSDTDFRAKLAEADQEVD